MKVDKSVSTNDMYYRGTTTQDSILKFENVFSTLVENKILAIKRECEENDIKKKSRTLKHLIKGKKPYDAAALVEYTPTTITATEAKVKKRRGNIFLRYKNSKKSKKCDVEEGDVEKSSTSVVDVTKFQVESEDSKNINLNSLALEESRKQKCDNNVENIQSTVNDESLQTTIDMSFQQSSVVMNVIPAATTQDPNNKSDIAMLDDVSSQNTSDIEFSLVSESIRDGHLKKKSSVTYSDPIVKQPKLPTMKLNSKISNRKAVSCHTTPIFERHKINKKVIIEDTGTVGRKDSKTFQDFPKIKHAVASNEGIHKSQTIVIASTVNSPTTKTAIASPSMQTVGDNGTCDLSKQQRKSVDNIRNSLEVLHDANQNVPSSTTQPPEAKKPRNVEIAISNDARIFNKDIVTNMNELLDRNNGFNMKLKRELINFYNQNEINF